MLDSNGPSTIDCRKALLVLAVLESVEIHPSVAIDFAVEPSFASRVIRHKEFICDQLRNASHGEFFALGDRERVDDMIKILASEVMER